MELGGIAPFIVFEGADLDAAAEGLLLAKFRNSGQACICANNILIQEIWFNLGVKLICCFYFLSLFLVNFEVPIIFSGHLIKN